MNSPGLNQDRSIRVFISSTFRDMQEERDVLMKVVFPKLRKLCEERGLTFTEVDLRWGITEEQAHRGEVLPICLAEVERCRPFFIGLLGERYGWIPNEIPRELVDQQPWLEEHRQTSVTELEIIHGVLTNPAMANRACFYFRDPAYAEQLPDECRADYVEQDPIARSRLKSLKERIRASNVARRDNYPNPQTLGEWALEDLTTAINQRFPPVSQAGPFDRDAAEHEAFARNRARIYVERNEYFERLDKHAKGNGAPLVVLGEPGSGKSALLSSWAIQYRAAISDDWVLLHFIGATPHSSDWTAMLRRILSELKRRFGIAEELPEQADALRTAFCNWLHMASAKCGVSTEKGDSNAGSLSANAPPRRIILILDALNQLEDRDGAPDLVWLPSTIPENVRFVLSSLPGRALDELKKRSWPTLTIEPLQTSERQQLIAEYLAQYSKTLSPDQTDIIVRAPQTANPLFLRALLEELRLYGEHFTLEQRINYYLAAATPADLYERILDRYEQDYERERPQLVQDTMSVLWAARRGLSETDMLVFLGRIGEKTLPQAIWSPLYLAAEQVLINRGGVFGFSHEYLRQAVERRYVQDVNSQLAIRQRLFKFCCHMVFGSVTGKSESAQSTINRLVGELPWQLARAGAWNELCQLLSDPIAFGMLWVTEPFEVRRYWAQLERNTDFRAIEAYGPVLEAPANHEALNHVEFVAQLLTQLGHVREGLRLNDYLLQKRGTTGDAEQHIKLVVQQANLLTELDQADRAIELLTPLEQKCRAEGEKNCLERVLMCLGNALLAQRDFEGALQRYREQEQLSRDVGNKWNLAISFGNQATAIRGQMVGAEVFDTETCDEAWVERKKARMDDAKLETALTLYLQEERAYVELGDQDGLQRCLGNQANVHADRRDFQRALELLTRKEHICRDTNNNLSLVYCLLATAQLHSLHFRKPARGFCQALEACQIVEAHGFSRGQHAARQCLRLALAGCLIDLQNHRGNPRQEVVELEQYCGLAERYEWANEARLAYSMLKSTRIAARRQRLAEECGISIAPDGQIMLPTSLLSNERFMKQWFGEEDHDLDEGQQCNTEPMPAKRLHTDLLEDNLQTKENSVEARNVMLRFEAVQLNALSMNVKAQGNHVGALNILEDARQKWEASGDESEVRWCLANQAILLQQRGEIDQALSLHKKEESLSRRLNDKVALRASLGNQAIAYAVKGECGKALELHKLEEDLCREIGDDHCTQISLGNQATVLLRLDDLDGALQRLNEQASICKVTGDLDGLQRSLGNQGIVQLRRGNVSEALALHQEQEWLARQIGQPEGIANALVNLAPLLAVEKRNEEAIKAASEARRIATEFNLTQLKESAEFLEKACRPDITLGSTHFGRSIVCWIVMLFVMLGAIVVSLQWPWLSLIGIPVALLCVCRVLVDVLIGLKCVTILNCAECSRRAVRFGQGEVYCPQCSSESRGAQKDKAQQSAG